MQKMRIAYTLAFILMVILISITEVNTQFECLPNGAPIPGVHRGGSTSFSASERQHPPASSIPPATSISPASLIPPASSIPPTRSHSPNRSSSRDRTALRPRSRSPSASYKTPPMRLPSSDRHGYGLDQLEFIRLIPEKNPNRQFELRRYTFSAGTPIKVLIGHNIFRPVPSQEQIVLSTSDGDVFAILEGDYLLGGIYTYDARLKYVVRAKINMESSKITPLTADEAGETPVGNRRLISHAFTIEHVNQCRGSRSPPRRCIAPPTRLPSSDGSVYGLDQLEFIQLISKKNPNQLFELRRYIFPTDKPILLLEGSNQYRPVPAYEQIVLSTFSGDVFAILESHNYFAGIYTYNSRVSGKRRAKINMREGTISPMTPDEMKDAPVGRLRPILNYFRVQNVNRNPPRHPINQN